MQLYGFGQSRSFRALWTLEEAGIKYEYIPIKFGSDESPYGSKSPEYLAINSQGKVPTLIDGDLLLTESAAIVNYIARKAPEKSLLPDNNQSQLALYEELMFFVLSDLEQSLWSNGKHRFALPEAQRIPAMLKTASWEFSKAQAALEHHLHGQEFILGDHFTAADIVVAHTINWAQRFEFQVNPVFLAYRDRHYSREAAIKALAIVT